MAKPKSGGKGVKTTTATAPANATSKSAPTQTTNAAIGGAGSGTASPKKKKKDARDEEKSDPVAVVKGAVVEDVVDLELPGILPFRWRRRYCSDDFAESTPFGRGGWTHDYHQWIEPEGDGFCLRNFDGADLSFGAADHGGALHRGRRLLLRRSGQRFEVLHLEERITRQYAADHPGGRAWLRSIADGYGNRLSLHYEGAALARITDTAGREIHLRRDAAGRIAAVDVEARGHTHRLAVYSYTDAGELESAADALGHALRYAYDGRHRLVRKRLRDGYQMHYQYDPVHGRVTRAWGDGGFHTLELTYDFDARTTTTHGEPQPRVYHWDAAGNILREETFDGRHVIEREWDEDHLLLSETNAAGEEHTFSYDDRGFLARHTDPAGNVTVYEHMDDALRRIVRPDGNVRVFQRDGFGGLWNLTLETGAAFSVDRDGRGRITALYGPTGVIERLDHDDHHNIVRVTGARGDVTTYRYDELGRPKQRTDPLGRSTRLEHDAAGRITAVIHADGTRIECAYDEAGRVTRIDKPGGQIVMERTGTGVLRSVTMEDGGQWHFTYDAEQKPVRIENPKGEKHELHYDRAGRIVEERTFDGRSLRYAYDLASRVHRIDRPDETWREISYDVLGNILEETSPHGTVTFERDAQGRVLSAKLEEGPVVSTVTFERDSAGRIIAETQDGETLRYAHDSENRRIERTLPGGEVTRFQYDLDGGLARVQHGDCTVELARDAAGQETSRRIVGSPIAIASRYDAMGRLAAQEAVSPRPEGSEAARALLRRTWEYDAVGRPVRIDDGRWGATDYFYDQGHHLVRAQRRSLDEAFEYDPAGGLVRAFSGLLSAGERWSVGQGDVLLRTPDAAYEYDACRRRTSKIELSNGKPTGRTTRYIWDCRDRLRQVHLPSGEVVRYFYDAFGRRTKKLIYPPPPADPAAAAPPPREVRFLWEDDVLAAEVDSRHGTRAFVHEPDTYRPLLQVEQGECFLYVLDQVGAPRELVDARGRVVWAAVYRAWGRLAEAQREAGAARARPIEFPFRSMGQYADEETGLHATRFRSWDPEVGRWCSPDPLGMDGGGALFGFGGSPTFNVDPLGLVPLDEEGYYVYGLFRKGEKEPYYVGITNDFDRRKGEHEESGKLGSGSKMKNLLGKDATVAYGTARGYEQAYMEFYGTKPPDGKGEPPGNVVNSFRHGRADNPEDERGQAFEKAYKERMAELEETGKAKAKQTC